MTSDHSEITNLREQVAAQAAVIEKLREALKMSCWYVIFFHDMSEEANSKTKSAEAIEVLNEALAIPIPTDSTQILDEVRRAERERCAKVCSGNLIDQITYAEHAAIKKCAAAIRAMG